MARKKRKRCFIVEDGVQCENWAERIGMCDKHYSRVRAHGSAFIKLPTTSTPIPSVNIKAIKAARRRGETLQQIGDRYGKTKQWTYWLLKKHGDPKKKRKKTAVQS